MLVICVTPSPPSAFPGLSPVFQELEFRGLTYQSPVVSLHFFGLLSAEFWGNHRAVFLGGFPRISDCL